MNIKNTLRRLWKSRQGGIAVIFAVSLIPLAVMGGLAIDVSQAYLVKNRLSHSLDAAGLAVGASTGTDQELQQIMLDYFNANYPAHEIGTPATPVMTIVDNTITLTATAEVQMSLMSLVGFDSIDVASVTEITREVKGLEVALVLDNTGSMNSSGKIDALKDASNDLIEILFGSKPIHDKLYVSLVPFVTTVNIGQANSSYVDNLGAFDYAPDVWKGCVEARDYPDDTLDSGGLWKPYFWEAETYYAPTSRNFTRSSSCKNRYWKPPAPAVYPLPPLGDPYRTTMAPFPAGGTTYLDTSPINTLGPNQACPQALTPLTNVKQNLLDDISQMTPWMGNGTMVNLGLGWGWRTVSPEAPFTEGKPYDDTEWTKAIIVLTDGENRLIGNSSRCEGTNPRYNSHYTGYGYLSDGRLGTTSSSGAAETQLNDLTAEVCENIKAKNITLYTITFQVTDPDTITLFTNCATSPSHFYNSPSNAELQDAFKTIANELRTLHISR
ncbi:MAG: pilus assembly protein [Rhodospirillales bacterium]|nr:pilus assembly protein [Rhodospirillales bacterium]